MFTKTSFVATAAALVGSVQAAPAGTQTDVAAASACTITSYSQVSGCLSSTAITVSNLQVPAGETLTLEKLQTGTTVTFTGTTTFGYKEWVRDSLCCSEIEASDPSERGKWDIKNAS